MGTEKLIGRQKEIAELNKAIERAREEDGNLILLAGEAGMGKTLLAEEVLRSSDALVLIGRAREGSTPPYGPLTSALRTCLRSLARGVRDCGPLSRYLNVLLPELGPTSEEAEGETLVEAIFEAIHAAAATRPVVLLLDDLHWADNATLEAIPQLADRIAGHRILLVGTYRSDEIPRGHPIRRLRNELRRTRRSKEIMIGPLNREETSALLEATLEVKPNRALADLVFQKTQGVPLYIEEMAEALAASGSLQDEDEETGLIPGETVPIPESIRDAVLLRLDGLSDPARDQLDIASVTGMEFDLEMVAELAGSEAGIEELIERNLITEAEHGSGSFRHALVREAIRGEIPWSKRRTLNHRIAAYLDRAGAPPERVAEHWLEAREHEPARRALLEIADRSCRLHAYRDAADAAHRALEIWPEGVEEEQRLASLRRLAHCAEVSGQLTDAIRALRELAGSPLLTRDDARRAEVMRSLGTVYGLQGSWEQARDARNEAARAFEAAGQPGEAAVEWLAVAARYTANSILDQALEAIRKADRLAADAGRTDLVIRARGFEGNVLAMQGKMEEGRRIAQAALSLALESSQVEAAADAYRRLASVLDYSSDFHGARDAYATAVDYCRSQGDDANARVCLGCMSAIVYRTGEWKRALDVSREVAGDTESAIGSSAVAHSIAGLIRAIRGEVRASRKLLKDALALARKGEARIIEIFSQFGFAVLAELEEDLDKAIELHQEVLEIWRTTQDRHDVVPFFLWQATFFARLQREPEVTQRADALATIASESGNQEAVASLAHALGEVALLSGNAEEASRQFAHARSLIERLEIPLELAITTWRLGSALALEGQRDAAVRHLTNAYRMTRNLGARPIASEIASELDRLGERIEEGRHPDEAARAGRGGLTRRQLEIARLIAEGLTNKEIAAKLFLSPRTVDMHVRNLLDRLDCRSRMEVARRVGELGLLTEETS